MLPLFKYLNKLIEYANELEISAEIVEMLS